MKKNIALKIILMLIILIVGCSIMKTVCAINANDVATSSNLFCRQYSAILPYCGDFDYDNNNGENTYTDTIGHVDAEKPYPYIFLFLNKTSEWISGSEAQKAYWNILGQRTDFTGWRTGYNQYKKYLMDLAEFPEPEVINENAYYDASTYQYGPMKIRYPQKYGYGIKDIKAYISNTNERISCTKVGEWSDFYIQFDGSEIAQKGVGNVRLEISYDYLESCTAVITNISSDATQCWALCKKHAKTIIPTTNPGTDKSVYYDLGGLGMACTNKYLFSYGESLYTQKGHEWDYESHEYKLYHTDLSSSYYDYTLRCINCGKETTYEKQQVEPDTIFECNSRTCNNAKTKHTITRSNAWHKSLMYTAMCQDFNPHTEGNLDGWKCGEKKTGINLQNLSRVRSSFTTGDGKIIEEIQLIPSIDINLVKHNSITNMTDENLPKTTVLSKANFEIRAYQRGTDGNLYELKVTDADGNGVRRIIPAAKQYLPTMCNNKIDAGEVFDNDYIYVLIKETNPPKGYKTINGPICIRFTLNYKDNQFVWDPYYRPTLEMWTYSGFINENKYDTIFEAWVNDLDQPDVANALKAEYNRSIKGKSNIGKEELIKQMLHTHFPTLEAEWNEFLNENIYYTIFEAWVNDLDQLDVANALKAEYNRSIKGKSNIGKEELIKQMLNTSFSNYISLEESWDKFLNNYKGKITDFMAWTWDEEHDPTTTGDKTDFPNIYKSNREDTILVEKIENHNNRKYIIRVFDEAIIEKLTLLKIDQDGGSSLLDGAKFKAVFQNVKSFKIGNNKYDGTKEHTFDVRNGKITITEVVYIDELKPIVVTLTETQRPADRTDYYYKELEGPITIKIEHTTKEGLEKDESKSKYEYNGTETIHLLLDKEANISNNRISYNNDGTVVAKEGKNYEATVVVPNLRLIDIGGTVWLDGNTGIKPVKDPSGLIDKDKDGNTIQSTRVSNVLAELQGDPTLRQFNNNTKGYIRDESGNYVTTTTTNENGVYSFIGLRYNRNYNVTFNYDGIHYIATAIEGDSKAVEDGANRTGFNNDYKVINSSTKERGTANVLSYEAVESSNIKNKDKKAYESYLKTLSSNNAAGKEYPVSMSNTRLEMGSIKQSFNMQASTHETDKYTAHRKTLNLGITPRATDVALATYLKSADVSINGETTTYNFLEYGEEGGKWIINDETGEYELIPQSTKDVKPESEHIYLYPTDFEHRIKDYLNNEGFNLKYYEDAAHSPEGGKTGPELEVKAEYVLLVQNQLDPNVEVSLVEYKYDDKYTLNGIYYKNGNEKVYLSDQDYRVDNNNVIQIRMSSKFETYGSRAYYLEFTVNKNSDGYVNITGDFYNTAEIMEYQTTEGLIDKDSAPGNFRANEINEDDSDQARGLSITVDKEKERKVSGYVWEDSNKNGVLDEGENRINDVIVQLIEVKEFYGQDFEYIWQETRSSGNEQVQVKKIVEYNNENRLENETYTSKGNGYYEFTDILPGNYIIRFIYGDGTTYDLTTNITKYNGQDYKSTKDINYSQAWFNNSEYAENASVARDNESRRLKTMAWSANVDVAKGALLKLLDVQTADKLNDIEKETLKKYYNAKYGSDVEAITDTEVQRLLKEETLANTWMCSDTSKVKISVNTEDTSVTSSETSVDGNNVAGFIDSIESVNLGLHERPKSSIELEKNLIGMKLLTSNGQTVVSATLNESGNIQTDGLQIIKMPGGAKWIYSVSPTEIHTIVDGAHLEYTYKITVTNKGEKDTIGERLASKYDEGNISEYAKYLGDESNRIKYQYPSGYSIGYYLGEKYYVGGTDEVDNIVKTEVKHISDYVNNDLTFVKNYSNKMDVIENTGATYHYKTTKDGKKQHYILNEKWDAKLSEIKTVLDITEGTKALGPNEVYDEYEVTLQKDPLSSSGTLDFVNYIAEVTNYTNAAGRRTFDLRNADSITSVTPGNAQAVNKDIANPEERPDLKLEQDESAMEEVHIEPALGEDKQTSYIWLITIVAGVAVIAAGTFVTKKYIVK